MIDIVTLRLIWWVLLGVLVIGFAITDGFDLGAAILFPFITKTDAEKRIVLNAIGPFWEGNQVWIILGAGAIFAAWPAVYAVSFSGFYLLILLLLLTLGISRPVSFKYRSKIPNPLWRACWDWGVFIGGLFPALIFGILIGNTLIGVPFTLDNTLRIFYTGTFKALFHPFALWCAVTSLWMLIMHGGLYLAIKTNDPIRKRAIFYSRFAAVLLILFFALGGFWVRHSLAGYQVLSGAAPDGYSNPLTKMVGLQMGAWMDNYAHYPLALLAPAVGFIGAFIVFLTARFQNSWYAFIASSFSIAGIITTVGVSMFPFILPSSAQPNASLLVWDASSNHLTLLVMLFAVIIFLPLILLYTSWVYRALSGKVSSETIENNKQAY